MFRVELIPTQRIPEKESERERERKTKKKGVMDINFKCVEGCFQPDCESKTATKRCSGCNNAWYCSEACQKAHWSIHKTFCKNGRASKGIDPLCVVKHCGNNGKNWLFPVCEQHGGGRDKGCMIQGCALFAVGDFDYCLVHICGEFMCGKRSSVCEAHTNSAVGDRASGRVCLVGTCETGDPPVESPFCPKHTCKICKFCLPWCGHSCTYPTCIDSVREEYAAGCDQHTCRYCGHLWPTCGHFCMVCEKPVKNDLQKCDECETKPGLD